MKPSQLNNQIPHSRIPLKWKNIEHLVVKLADARESNMRIVDLLTDSTTSHLIMLRFFRGARVKIVPFQESSLGFQFTSIHCSDGKTELRVVSDKWLDDYRKRRIKRGWRRRVAYAIDWPSIKIADEQITALKRTRHRRITFQ